MSQLSFPLPDLPTAKEYWTDEQRRAVWCLICKSRKGLQVELSPIIATAFVILQHYFRNSDDNPYNLFVLMTAALFAACKGGDCFRPLEIIRMELIKILKASPQAMIKSFVGDGQTIEEYIQPNDCRYITRAELDLLQSVDFDLSFELPFEYFERWRRSLTTIPNDNFLRFCNQIIVDICLVLCSKYYLDLPPEVAAAAAAIDIVPNESMPAEIAKCIEEITGKYGKPALDTALRSICQERARTAFRKPNRCSPGHYN